MLQIPKLDIKPYKRLIWRRKWWVAVPLFLSIFAARGYLSISPKTFKASTLVLLEPQRIPTSFVKSTISESIAGSLSTIDQEIYSRTNIERIIQDFHLSAKKPADVLERILRLAQEHLSFVQSSVSFWRLGPETDQVLMNELIQRIKDNIQVRLIGYSDAGVRNMSFEISFEWYDQNLVAPVTNAIAARFIEQNLSARQGVATNTTNFLTVEASSIKSELEVREKELEKFRQKNMGMLPDQQQSNLAILAQLRDQVSALEANIEQENQQALFLSSQEQISSLQRSRGTRSVTSPTGTSQGNSESPEAAQMTFSQFTGGSLEHLEAELDGLRAVYTEKHPDVIALERRIAKLKEQGGASHSGVRRVVSLRAPEDGVSRQLAMIKAQIEADVKQIENVQGQIEIYKQRVEREPQIEMEMSNVLRGYETVRQRYNSLLDRKLDAEMSEALQRQNQGEQFRILDQAVRPPKPFRPDPLRVVLMALAGGLGMGLCLAYLGEMLDPAFYSPEDVRDILKREVIVSLPVADMKDK